MLPFLLLRSSVRILLSLYYKHIRVHMGGDHYDRSAHNPVLSNQNAIHIYLDPSQERNRKHTDALNPIVFALDVTGSMGQWVGIIYDKIPMFYEQIITKGYLKDPALSFCAVGDATCDESPFQVTPFVNGTEIDSELSKIWIEKGGGDTDEESYQLAAYFYNRYARAPNKQLGFFFITGDQDYYTRVNPVLYQRILCCRIQNRIEGEAQFQFLKTQYEVFLLKKEYTGDNEQKIYSHWCKTLGEARVIKVEEPKSCIDIMLGIIAMTSRARDLEDYVYDMEQRGQDEVRICHVRKALGQYNQHLAKEEHFKDYVPVKREEVEIKEQTKLEDEEKRELEDVPNTQVPENLCQQKQEEESEMQIENNNLDTQAEKSEQPPIHPHSVNSSVHPQPIAPVPNNIHDMTITQSGKETQLSEDMQFQGMTEEEVDQK